MADEVIPNEPEPVSDPSGAEETPPPPPVRPRFGTAPYYLSPPPFLGLLLLFTALPALGLLVGLLTSVVSQWLYLMIIFPLIMGAIVGAFGRRIVKRAKVRFTLLLWAAVGLTTAAMMFGLNYGEYLFELRAENAKFPGILEIGIRDPRFFLEYMKSKAQQDVVFTHFMHGAEFHSRSKGMVMIWLIEACLAGGAIYALIRHAAEGSFCRRCQNWIPNLRLGKLEDGSTEVLSLQLRNGDLLCLLDQASPQGELGLQLLAAVCPACGPGQSVDIALARVTRSPGGKLETNYHYRVRYPVEVLAFLDANRAPQ